ncbi:MAG: hypothetical protein AAF830_15500 [Pseudomonadota bacterium]
MNENDRDHRSYNSTYLWEYFRRGRSKEGAKRVAHASKAAGYGAAKFEAVGFTPRQAQAIEERLYFFTLAFYRETLDKHGPCTMPDHVRQELVLHYRRGGFPEHQVQALANDDGMNWANKMCQREERCREVWSKRLATGLQGPRE